LIQSAKFKLFIASPYYSSDVLKRILTLARADTEKQFLLDVNEGDMAAGTQSGVRLLQHAPNSEVRTLPNLHAKLLIADENVAIVTSANLTWTALKRNVEYGVMIDEPNLMKELLDSVRPFWEGSEPLDFDELPNPRKRGKGKGSSSVKKFGHDILPPDESGPEWKNWIVVHTEFSSSSQMRQQLREMWGGDKRWYWTEVGRHPLKEGGPHIVLLECSEDGRIVADGVATVIREQYKDPDSGKEYDSAFVFRHLNFPTGKVFLSNLLTGKRETKHHALITLDDSILEAYAGLAYDSATAPPYLPTAVNSSVRFPEDVPKWWKMSPGRSGEKWDEWYLNDFISIGWNGVGDLKRFQCSRKRLREVVKAAAKKAGWETDEGKLVWKSPQAIDYRVDQLATFAGWGEGSLRKGDGVIAYSGTTAFAVCIVDGLYDYRDDLEDAEREPFLHTRKIRWLKVLPNESSYPRAPSRIITALGKKMRWTLKRIDDESIVKEVWQLPQWRQLQA
jgi:hypothetical protein